MSWKAISTASAPPPAGTYSQAVRGDGPLVFISGQTPRLLDGSRLIGAPFDEQVRRTLDNIEAIARAAGLSLRDAVKVNVFLRNLNDKVAFDTIYAEYVGDPSPARTLTQSTFVEFDVEVDVILIERHCARNPCMSSEQL
jgi:2-iminobutanoate/2-iminopropanoate deaminase